MDADGILDMTEVQAAILKAAGDVVQQVTKDIISKALEIGRKEVKKFAVEFEYVFLKILDRNYRAIQKVKTLANPSSPISIEAIYVTPDVEINNQRVDGQFFIDSLKEMNFCVITALAGSGKSVFLKRLFIHFFKEDQTRIPVFLELRLIASTDSLKDYIIKTFNIVGEFFDSELFDFSLSLGKYVFLLDDFDEIAEDSRNRISDEIVSLSTSYPGNMFVVTSRPDTLFASWQMYFQVKIAAFSKEQVIGLINKINFSKDRKKIFVEKIKLDLYETHETYLSNPLLCIIMLLTYNQKAEIPSATSAFFKLAFEALLFRHDTHKAGVYKRAYRVKVGAERFTDLCSSFSAFSYFGYGSSIRKEMALLCAKRALTFEQIDSEPDDFLFDLCTSLSIAVEEGGQISYIHRTFQEYLTALFLSNREIKNWGDVVEKIQRKHRQDNVVSLIAEINPDKFRVYFLWPRLRGLIDDINEIDFDKNPIGFFNLFYLGVGVGGDDVIYWTIQVGSERRKWVDLLAVIQRVYSPEVDIPEEGSRWRQEFKNIVNKSNLRIHNDELGENVEIKRLSNQIIKRTPLNAYLRSLKAAIITLDIKFQRLEQERDELLSNMISK